MASNFSEVSWSLLLSGDLAPNGFAYTAIYSLQLVVASVAVVSDSAMTLAAFKSESYFSPYQSFCRTLLFIDVLLDTSYVVDAGMALLLPAVVGPGGLVSIYECAEYKPYLFVVIVGRQWGAHILVTMGLERFLSMKYPLWFRNIRMRKEPIVVMTLLLSMFSASFAHTNVSSVQPWDVEYFTCEATFAFGSYGYIHCFFVLVPLLGAFLLNAWAAHDSQKERVLVRFGNNRQKLNIEKRKIRKAMPILGAYMLCVFLPQALLLALRSISSYRLQLLKLLVSQLFLCKFLANLIVYRIMTRWKEGIFDAIKKWLAERRKVKVGTVETIATISQSIR